MVNKHSLSARTLRWIKYQLSGSPRPRPPRATFRPAVESKRVDEFANMSDEELRQYVYGKELDS